MYYMHNLIAVHEYIVKYTQNKFAFFGFHAGKYVPYA